MKHEQRQIEKCPVCKNSTKFDLDWVIFLESEEGFVSLFRCSLCFSPFFIRRNDGSIIPYLGDGTK